MRHGEVEAQVKTGRVVDLWVPAAQEEGEDGQSKEEEADNHAHSVKPLQKRIRWCRLRTQRTSVFRRVQETEIVHVKDMAQAGAPASFTSAICMMRAKVDRWEQLHTVKFSWANEIQQPSVDQLIWPYRCPPSLASSQYTQVTIPFSGIF